MVTFGPGNWERTVPEKVGPRSTFSATAARPGSSKALESQTKNQADQEDFILIALSSRSSILKTQRLATRAACPPGRVVPFDTAAVRRSSLQHGSHIRRSRRRPGYRLWG